MLAASPADAQLVRLESHAPGSLMSWEESDDGRALVMGVVMGTSGFDCAWRHLSTARAPSCLEF